MKESRPCQRTSRLVRKRKGRGGEGRKIDEIKRGKRVEEREARVEEGHEEESVTF